MTIALLVTSRQQARHTAPKAAVSQTSRLHPPGPAQPRHLQLAHLHHGPLTQIEDQASTFRQPSTLLPTSHRLRLLTSPLASLHHLHHPTFRVTPPVKSPPQRHYLHHHLDRRSALPQASHHGRTLSQSKLAPNSAATQMLLIAQEIGEGG